MPTKKKSALGTSSGVTRAPMSTEDINHAGAVQRALEALMERDARRDDGDLYAVQLSEGDHATLVHLRARSPAEACSSAEELAVTMKAIDVYRFAGPLPSELREMMMDGWSFVRVSLPAQP